MRSVHTLLRQKNIDTDCQAMDKVKADKASAVTVHANSPEDRGPATEPPGLSGFRPLTPGGRVTLRLPCIPEYYRVCRLLISGIAQRVPLPWDLVEDLKLAVSEACSLVCGALEPNAEGSVLMNVEVRTDSIEVSIEGPPGGAQATSNGDEEFETTAMGLFFIQSLMDQVDYAVGRNQAATLRMIKILSEEGDDVSAAE